MSEDVTFLAKALETALRERNEARAEFEARKKHVVAIEEVWKEAIAERDEAKRRLELITSYRDRHREAIRKANAERDEAREKSDEWQDRAFTLEQERDELAWALTLYFAGINPFSLPEENKRRFAAATALAKRLARKRSDG